MTVPSLKRRTAPSSPDFGPLVIRTMSPISRPPTLDSGSCRAFSSTFVKTRQRLGQRRLAVCGSSPPRREVSP
eukprot:scaffold4353_cov217-Pinguiococcus_pyrenoidosus.AAC.6